MFGNSLAALETWDHERNFNVIVFDLNRTQKDVEEKQKTYRRFP